MSNAAVNGLIKVSVSIDPVYVAWILNEIRTECDELRGGSTYLTSRLDWIEKHVSRLEAEVLCQRPAPIVEAAHADR